MCQRLEEEHTLYGQRYGHNCTYYEEVEILDYLEPEFQNNGAICFANAEAGVVLNAATWLRDELEAEGYGPCSHAQQNALSGPKCPAAGYQVAALPQRYVEDCERPAQAPELCTWVGALDGLYVGNVTSIEMVAGPAVASTGPAARVVEDCASGSANEALQVTLSVSKTLLGESTDEVTFRIGAKQAEQLSPRPVTDATAGVMWHGGLPGIVVGDTLGVPLHEGPDGSLSPLGELMMTFGADDEVLTQATNRCVEPPAYEHGTTLARLETALSSCGEPGAEAAARHERFEQLWSVRSWSDAAQCLD